MAHTKTRKAVPLRTAIKETLMYLFCHGVLPKDVAQRVFDLLDLKKD